MTLRLVGARVSQFDHEEDVPEDQKRIDNFLLSPTTALTQAVASGEETWTCDECARTFPLKQQTEHLDWHVARRLQSMGRRRTVARAIRGLRTKCRRRNLVKATYEACSSRRNDRNNLAEGCTHCCVHCTFLDLARGLRSIIPPPARLALLPQRDQSVSFRSTHHELLRGRRRWRVFAPQFPAVSSASALSAAWSAFVEATIDTQSYPRIAREAVKVVR